MSMPLEKAQANMKIGYLMQTGVPDIRSDHPSGPAIHVKRVIEELGKLGHQVRLLAALDHRMWKSDNLVDFLPITVPSIDMGILHLLERGVRRIQYELQLPYAALFESIRFALACRQELAGYDLFYERMGWFGYGGGLAAHWLGIPLILEVNGDPLGEMEMLGVAPQGTQRWLSTFLMKRAVKMASHAVASGEGWRSRYSERWGEDFEKVTVAGSGSELVNLLERDQLRSFRSSSSSGDATTIVYLGGFDPWQGVTVLIRAVARVIANGTPVHLLMIGSGSGVKTAEQLVNELDLAKHVTFTGQLVPQQYADCLAQVDIGVSPYCGWPEYFGLKLLDYKAAGLAIIASGKNGQPVIIDHGRTGWVVPPCDENALYEALVRLCSDREFAKHMGREARIEAERLHSWKNTAEQISELFKQVIKDYRGTGNAN